MNRGPFKDINQNIDLNIRQNIFNNFRLSEQKNPPIRLCDRDRYVGYKRKASREQKKTNKEASLFMLILDSQCSNRLGLMTKLNKTLICLCAQ